MSRRRNQEEEMSDTPMEPTGTLSVRAREFISSKNPLQHGSNCKVLLVSPGDISVVWDDVVEFIDLALKHSENLIKTGF